MPWWGLSHGFPGDLVDYNELFTEVVVWAGLVSFYGTALMGPDEPLGAAGLDLLAYLARPNNKALQDV